MDSGDIFTRGPLCNAYEGLADTEAMNAIGYDLAAIGNNEFKAKDAVDQNDAAGARPRCYRSSSGLDFPGSVPMPPTARGRFWKASSPMSSVSSTVSGSVFSA